MSTQGGLRSGTPRIAIAGATGRVGSILAQLLSRDPVQLVALTRKPGDAKVPEGVEVTKVDFGQPSSLEAALKGVERLFIAHGSSPTQVTNEIALIDAASAVGVRHIVKLSIMGPATRIKPFAWHMEIESHLARQALASTVLRASAFAYVLKRAGNQVAAGSWSSAAGDGRVNFVDTRDLAEVARLALLEEIKTPFQRAYHLTGPQTWTMPQIAGVLSEMLGHRVSYTQRTLGEQRASLAASGLSPFVVDLLVDIDEAFLNSALGEVTTTIQDLTGHVPRPLTDWLTENLGSFRADHSA